MNKYFGMVLILWLFSCIKISDSTSILYRYVINKTQKNMVLIIETDVKQDTIYSVGIDSVGKTFQKITAGNGTKIAGTIYRAPRVEIKKEILFNLSDTLSAEYCYQSLLNTTFETAYFNSNTFALFDNSTDENPSIIQKLLIVDTLLQYMTKDDTMLEKFKDYYSTPH